MPGPVGNPALSFLHAHVRFYRTFEDVNTGEYDAVSFGVSSIFQSSKKHFDRTEFCLEFAFYHLKRLEICLVN